MKLPSSEFQRIVKDLATIGDTGATILPGRTGLLLASAGDGFMCLAAPAHNVGRSASDMCAAAEAAAASTHPSRCMPIAPLFCCLLFLAVEISVTKDAVKFSTSGDIGSANVMCRHVAWRSTAAAAAAAVQAAWRWLAGGGGSLAAAAVSGGRLAAVNVAGRETDATCCRLVGHACALS